MSSHNGISAPRGAPALAVAALLLAHFLLCAGLVGRRDLLLDYPFPSGDMFDYACNAWFLQGENVPFSGRAPGLPAAIAALDGVGALALLPALLLALFHLAGWSLHQALRELATPAAAAIGVLLYLASASHLYFSSLIDGAGPGAALLVMAWSAWLRGRPVRAGALAGASFLVHQLALLFPLAVLAVALAPRRAAAHGKRDALRMAAAFAPFPRAFAANRWSVSSSVDPAMGAHWPLLRPDLDALPTYAVLLLSYAGLPGVVLGALGAAAAWRRRDGAALVVGLLAGVLAFFAVGYDWNDKRFLAYAYPLLAACAAFALAAPGRRLARRLLAAWAIATALTPQDLPEPARLLVPVLPGAGLSLPIVYPGGSVRLADGAFGAARIATADPRWIYHRRVASRAPGAAVLRPTPPGRDRPAHALFIWDGEQPPGYYGLRTRTSALLRADTRIVPLAVARGSLRSFTVSGESATLAAPGHAPQGATIARHAATGAAWWLVAQSAGGAELAVRGQRGRAVAAPRDRRGDEELARTIARFAGRSPILALADSAGSVPPGLPLLLGSNVRYLLGGEAAEARRFLARLAARGPAVALAPGLAPGVNVRAYSFEGVAWTVLTLSGAADQAVDEPLPAAPAPSPARWCDLLPRPGFSRFERLSSDEDWFQVYRMNERLYALAEPFQYQEAISYLILGERRALLFDTGLGLAAIAPVVRRLTALPVVVVNSHSHFDHVGGNHEFESVLAIDTPFTRERSRGLPHEALAGEVAPAALCRALPAGTDPAAFAGRPFTPREWIGDGHRVDLGGRVLEVLHVPGHTPDAIALFDAGEGQLFTGDSFYPGPIWLFMPETDLDAFERSLARLVALQPRVRTVLGAHNEPTAPPERLSALRDAMARIRSGALSPVPRDDGGLEFFFDGFSVLTSAAAIRGE